MTIILAGGSGFLGRALASRLELDGHTVLTLTRRPRTNINTDVLWNPDGGPGPWADSLDLADIIVNLAGEGIADSRWTSQRKRLLRDSRIRATRSLVSAVAAAPPRPRLFVSGSAIGFYGAHGDEALTETTPPGNDFLARLCVEWEHEASRAASEYCTVATIRTGIVLHPRGGALARMLPPFRFGVGGPMGSGRQYMSWIHREDWVSLVTHIVSTHAGRGRVAGRASDIVTAYNLSAPRPVTNQEFARVLAGVLNRPAFFRVPAIAMRLAFGEMAEAALLSGARVLPARAEAEGFRFAYPELEPALRNLFGRS